METFYIIDALNQLSSIRINTKHIVSIVDIATQNPNIEFVDKRMSQIKLVNGDVYIVVGDAGYNEDKISKSKHILKG